ncbi:MAG: hypothetical protein QXX24_03770 [Candidatus Bathyarchaeia archaeon]
MGGEKRFWIQLVTLILLGIVWLARALIDNSFTYAIIGLVFALGAISFTLTTHIVSDSKIKRYTEIILFIALLGIIICGYVMSGALMLMILMIALATFLILGFILSYLLPKIHGEK